jgi:hypothetical protein
LPKLRHCGQPAVNLVLFEEKFTVRFRGVVNEAILIGGVLSGISKPNKIC